MIMITKLYINYCDTSSGWGIYFQAHTFEPLASTLESGWFLSSPPKPDAFVSLPLQSKLNLKFSNLNFSNLKEKFTLKNIFITFVSLVFAYILKLYLTYLLTLEINTWEHYLLLGFISSTVRPLFMDLFEIIFPPLYCMDKDIERSIAAKTEPVGNSGASGNQSREPSPDFSDHPNVHKGYYTDNPSPDDPSESATALAQAEAAGYYNKYHTPESAEQAKNKIL